MSYQTAAENYGAYNGASTMIGANNNFEDSDLECQHTISRGTPIKSLEYPSSTPCSAKPLAQNPKLKCGADSRIEDLCKFCEIGQVVT